MAPSRPSASARPPGARSTRTRTACRSACPSRARCSPSRRCCSSTRPPTTWTRPPRTRCASSRRSAPLPASRSLGDPARWRNCPASPTRHVARARSVRFTGSVGRSPPWRAARLPAAARQRRRVRLPQLTAALGKRGRVETARDGDPGHLLLVSPPACRSAPRSPPSPRPARRSWPAATSGRRSNARSSLSPGSQSA